MIKLTPRFEGFKDEKEPFVAMIAKNKNCLASPYKVLQPSAQKARFKTDFNTVDFDTEDLAEGEILLMFPKNSMSVRFYRPNEKANTILLTERCDQYCNMCSQPPKNKDYTHWELYFRALLIFPQNSVVGISGGEPTLHKTELFEFLKKINLARPDISFHILSNGQHFSIEDKLKIEDSREFVTWGIPIYSHNPKTHDQIVGKNGAFERLFHSMSVLLKAGARVELRTVLMQDNHKDMPKLAKIIGKYFQWIEVWSIMQLEKIGFARIDWQLKFVDTSSFFDWVSDAILIAKACGINVQLYNFPTCTVPPQHRKECVNSISDWKQKYIDECKNCIAKETCCGFFEWYHQEDGFNHVRKIQ